MATRLQSDIAGTNCDVTGIHPVRADEKASWAYGQRSEIVVMMTGSKLEAIGLATRVGGRRVLHRCDLELRSEEIVALAKPGVAGQTLVDVLAGRVSPLSGRIELNGRDVTRLGPVARTRRGIGHSLRERPGIPSMPVLDNVRLAVLARRTPRLFNRVASDWRSHAAATTLLERVGLHLRALDFPTELSKLELRRLQLALVLAGKPHVMLLDGPLDGLTPGEAQEMLDLIALLGPVEGRSVLMTAPDAAPVRRVADRVMTFDEGRLVTCTGGIAAAEAGLPEAIHAG